MDLILASSSPRRRALLREMGVEFEVIAPEIDEEQRPGERPKQSAERLAIEKAMAVARGRPGFTVIGADTIVLLDGETLGKPKDFEDARRMLRLLQGREHCVITGVAVVRHAGEYRDACSARTAVCMKPLSPEEIDWYIGTGEPMDKAGAYALQGKGAILIERVRGCYTNVIGLPLPTLGRMMVKAGVRFPNGRRPPEDASAPR